MQRAPTADGGVSPKYADKAGRWCQEPRAGPLRLPK